MTKDKGSAAGKFALGVLIGAAAGAIVGILTAPKSGKETREDIRRKASEVKDITAEKLDEAKEYADGKTKEAKKFATEKTADAKDFIEREKKAIKEAAKKPEK